jgi:iron-sulfur cluster insertion protein
MADSQSVVQSFVPQPLRMSLRAAAKVRELLEDEGESSLRLRVYVTGGGCAGFRYGFSFDDQLAEDDTVVVQDSVAVVVDALSLPYLEGSEIDYQEGLQGSQFTVNNPNASSTCGCGASFSA